jgi:hypothetical protein
MDNTKFQVFLDLEQTVITNWDDGLLANTTQVREFLAAQGARQFTVFSFAVWNDQDHEDFQRRHRRVLERGLDCFCAACPTVQHFMKADTEVTGVHFDSLTDFISIRGKVGAFTNWVKSKGISHALLVDDVVPNIDIVDRDTGNVIRFVNVDSL